MAICAFEECAEEFQPRTHNQKYHTDECCRIATNKRIMEKYYEKKARKNGGARQCKVCKIKLNKYNIGDLCGVHEAEVNSISRRALLELVGFEYRSTG